MFDPYDKPASGWRRELYTIIYETETRLGWAFDAALLVAILLSLVAVALETVQPFGTDHARAFYVIELVLTALFTIEYEELDPEANFFRACGSRLPAHAD